MDKQALANLKDIQLPNPIGVWPLAPGWWILIIISILLILFIGWQAWQVYLRNRAKKKALRLLADYKNDYQATQNSIDTAAKLSILLRRVAIAYYPRQQVASLKGEAWIDFLDKHSKHTLFADKAELLLSLPYQANTNQSTQPVPCNPLFNAVEAWIKQRGKRC